MPAASVKDRRTAISSAAVIGVGNVLMGDDGIGVEIIRALEREPLLPNVELFDAGTALLDVLPFVSESERMIIVDCCRAGGEPGTIYISRLSPETWRSQAASFSAHDLGVVEALQMHIVSGARPRQIVLIGVEPESVCLREGLSPALRSHLPRIVQTVIDQLKSEAPPGPCGDAAKSPGEPCTADKGVTR